MTTSPGDLHLAARTLTLTGASHLDERHGTQHADIADLYHVTVVDTVGDSPVRVGTAR